MVRQVIRQVVRQVIREVVRQVMSPVKLSEKQMAILELIRKDSRISVKEMSLVLSQVERTIKRQLADLQKKGILIREGNTSAGHWEIIEK